LEGFLGKKAPPTIKRAMLTKAVEPRPLSEFLILLDAHWNDGHQRFAQFRDGQLDHLKVEG
jgi:hypothetical protein